jgi:hypothetical protein
MPTATAPTNKAPRLARTSSITETKEGDCDIAGPVERTGPSGPLVIPVDCDAARETAPWTLKVELQDKLPYFGPETTEL